MKAVYPVCCGVDVHKSFLVATIITTTHSLEPHYEKKRFSVYNRDLHLFADWLISNNCFDLCMESTGKYWIPVFNILEERGIHVVTLLHFCLFRPLNVYRKERSDPYSDKTFFRLLFLYSFIPPMDKFPMSLSLNTTNRTRMGSASSIHPAIRKGIVAKSPCESWLNRKIPLAKTGEDGI